MGGKEGGREGGREQDGRREGGRKGGREGGREEEGGREGGREGARWKEDDEVGKDYAPADYAHFPRGTCGQSSCLVKYFFSQCIITSKIQLQCADNDGRQWLYSLEANGGQVHNRLSVSREVLHAHHPHIRVAWVSGHPQTVRIWE